MIKVTKQVVALREATIKPGALPGVTKLTGTQRLYTMNSMPGILFKYHATFADIIADCQGIAFQVWNGTTLSPLIHIAMGEHARFIIERGFVPNSLNWAMGSPHSDTNLELVRAQAYMGADSSVFDWDLYSSAATKSTRMLAPTQSSWPQGGRDTQYTAVNCELRNVMGIVNEADFGYICSTPLNMGVAHSFPSAEGGNAIYGQMGTRITLGYAGDVLRNNAALLLNGAPDDVKPFMVKAIAQVAEIYKTTPMLATIASQWESAPTGLRVRSGFSLPSLSAVDRAGNPQDLYISSQTPDRPFSPNRIVTLRASEFNSAITASVVSKHRIADTYDWPTGRILPVSAGSHTGGTFGRVFKMLLEPERFVDPGLNTASYAGDPTKFQMSVSDRRAVPKEVAQWTSSYYGHPMIGMLQNMTQRVYDVTEQLIKESAK